MWCDYLDNNFFVKKLYKKVPELNNVSIEELNIQREGERISILFDLPYYADFPPQKWIDSKYNTTIIQVDLFSIHQLYMEKVSSGFFRGSIEIFTGINKLVNVKIHGNIRVEIVATIGSIQRVSGCLVDTESDETSLL